MLRRATIQDLHKIVYVFNESMEDMEEHGYDKLDYLGEDTFRDGIENGYIYVRGIGTDIGGFIFISSNEILNSSHIKWSKNITCLPQQNTIQQTFQRPLKFPLHYRTSKMVSAGDFVPTLT